MTLSPDITSDYTVIDNLDQVSYSVRLGESKYEAAVSVGSAQREPQLYEQTTAGALLPRVTSYWSFWTAALTAVSLGKPQIGDQFVDADGLGWQVLNVESNRWRTGWRLHCLKTR